jgi:hypothetical protein
MFSHDTWQRTDGGTKDKTIDSWGMATYMGFTIDVNQNQRKKKTGTTSMEEEIINSS